MKQTFKKRTEQFTGKYRTFRKRLSAFYIGTAASVSTALLGMTAHAATAEENAQQTLQNLETTSKTFFNTIQDYTWILVAAAFVVCGALYILGGEEGRQRSNRWIPKIIIGTFIIVGAVSLAGWLVGNIAHDKAA